MAEIKNANNQLADPGAQAAPGPAQVDASASQSSELQSRTDSTKIRGRFNQYQSSYWVLAVPLLAVRYFAEGVNELFKPREVMAKLKKDMAKMTPDEASAVTREIERATQKAGGINWKKDIKKGFWVLPVAGVMAGATSYYSLRTYQDMKSQFAEPLAWEFDKPPEKIGLKDMLKSKNTLIHDAISNLGSRTLLRFSAHLPFLAFLLPGPKNEYGYAAEIKKIVKLKGEAGGYEVELKKLYDKRVTPNGAKNLAVGTESAYLASDALLRKRTFFEELQAFVDTKINHTDKVGEIATAADLLNLYDLQARNNPAVRPLPKMDSVEWRNDQKLFERMASLVNQTYGNTPNTEQANFTMPKLIYMLGMRLLKSEDPQRNMAYLELANRHGIKAVEKVARIAGGHGDLSAALASYPDIAQRVFGQEYEGIPGAAVQPSPPQPEKIFANESLRRARVEAPPASQVDKIAQNSEAGAGFAVSH